MSSAGTDTSTRDSTESTPGPIRVFILDDHEVVRNGVRAMVDAQPDMEVVAEAADAAQAIEVVAACSPDVAIVDVRLRDGNGIDVCREIRSQFNDVRTLILTSFESDRAIVEAGLAGASGFVLKQIRSTELIDAVRLVARGRLLLDNAEVRLAMRRLRESDEGALLDLTPQEQRIFDLIGDSRTNREIAQEMHLAEKTVKNYVSNVLAKLGMSRRTEAAALSARLDARRQRDR